MSKHTHPRGKRSAFGSAMLVVATAAVGGVFLAAVAAWGAASPLGLAVAAFTGGSIGFAALPYFDARDWPPRPLVCAALGAGAGGLIGFASDVGVVELVVAGAAGGALGYFAARLAPRRRGH